MWVQSLGQEDPLEKEMATHSSILDWEMPQIEEPGKLQSMGLQKSQAWLCNWAHMQIQHGLLNKPVMEASYALLSSDYTWRNWSSEINESLSYIITLNNRAQG